MTAAKLGSYYDKSDNERVSVEDGTFLSEKMTQLFFDAEKEHLLTCNLATTGHAFDPDTYVACSMQKFFQKFRYFYHKQIFQFSCYENVQVLATLLKIGNSHMI